MISLKLYYNLLELLKEYKKTYFKRVESKLMHIDDAYGHLTEDGYIGPARYIKFKIENTSPVKVLRKPYLGIICEIPRLSYALTVILNDLGIPTINMSDLKIAELSNVEKIVDYLYIVGHQYNNILKNKELLLDQELHNVNKGLKNIFIKISKSPYIYIFSDLNYITCIITILYVIRLVHMIIFNIPIKIFPIINVSTKYDIGIYPVKILNKNIKITHDLEDIDGFLVVDDDGEFIELFSPPHNRLSLIPSKK